MPKASKHASNLFRLPGGAWRWDAAVRPPSRYKARSRARAPRRSRVPIQGLDARGSRTDATRVAAGDSPALKPIDKMPRRN